MDLFVLYLLMQADSICRLFVFFAFVFGITASVLCITFACSFDESFDTQKDLDRKQKLRPKMKRWFLFLWFLCFLSAMAATLFPKTKTLAVMIGGHYALEAAKSDTAKKIMELVNLSIDEALNNAKKGKGQ